MARRTSGSATESEHHRTVPYEHVCEPLAVQFHWPYARGMDVAPLTRDQARESDRRATEDYGISSIVLMENAGRGSVDVLERLGIAGPVVIICGKGNNAGDGFVIARHLEIRRYACRVLLLSPPAELRGDAAANFHILQKTDVTIVDLSTAQAAQSGTSNNRRLVELNQHADDADWLVDAILGTGAIGDPRPPFDIAIDWMNSHPAKKLAIDVPSGLDCDSGQPSAHTLRADHTCTFAANKIGFMQPIAKPYVGKVHVCDIGVPPQLLVAVGEQLR
jgi:NAD(P)H-hydrate epimerase